MSSLQTKRHCKRAIYLTKAPFQLHDNLRYSGSEITFFGRRQLTTEIFFRVARWKTSSPNSVNKIFLHSETQKLAVFQDNFCMKIFLLLNDRKSQIPRVKALKYRVFETEFSSNR